jgi:hypothetical protein
MFHVRCDRMRVSKLIAQQPLNSVVVQVATTFKDYIIPRSVEWFTGEAAPPMLGEDYEGEGDFGDFGDFEDEDFEEEPPAAKKKK